MPRRVVTAALSPVARDANRNGNRNFPRVHAARRPERAHHYEIGRVHLGSAPRLVPPAHRGSPSAGVAPGLDSLGTAVPGATSSSRCARPPTTPSLGQTLAGSPGGTCGAAQRGWGRCFGDGLARWRRRGANRLGHRRDRGPEDRLTLWGLDGRRTGTGRGRAVAARDAGSSEPAARSFTPGGPCSAWQPSPSSLRLRTTASLRAGPRCILRSCLLVICVGVPV